MFFLSFACNYRAQGACPPVHADHFADVRKMIGFRKGGQRDVETMHVITHRKVFG